MKFFEKTVFLGSLTFFFLFVNQLSAQKYAVHCKDKNNSPYSIDKPLEFLSQKALDRRSKFSISVTKEDFPVNPNYIEQVRATGAVIIGTSRWSNSILVDADDNVLNKIIKLDFVKETVLVKPAGFIKSPEIHPKWSNETFEIINHPRNDYEYGAAKGQIEQLNGIIVHKEGYTGEGVLIAVLDAGFQNAREITGFSHLFESGRILMERDVVAPGQPVCDENSHSHGTMVLSCMGGFISGEYVGTAPQASYALIRTEDAPTEFPIEEYFWMIGAEIADSLGADIINSSLGYTTFDDTLMNHKYSDLDGKTIVSSIAAKMAVERGVFVTNSAGNSFGKPFPWVGSPADAPEALAIAGVDINGGIYNFSSLGYNREGYSKPDVAACGYQAVVIWPFNFIGFANGTSFASPITCGMVACVIQAAPHKKPHEIMDAIHKSAKGYPNHDLRYGYGIPDFKKVLQLLGVLSVDEIANPSKLVCSPNPVTDMLLLNNPEKLIHSIEFYDIAGKMIKNTTVNARQTSVDMNGISAGFIFIKVHYDDGGTETAKCVKY